ncbi:MULTISPECIES: penicillin-binding protein 2 [Stutzerimonas stutzeri subgroup]|uniref:Peptidoglycan D,D-transpeptidase MrdA n=2 Tax=Gammaproteobacteria TaxID=1236 RepID=A0A2N8RDD7_STUST|nr:MULTISPECIES: penicillin-binding protein 2 [Stutzerimonas stutzeri subgroup]KRW66664.1 penicillin-binding protein 2 [Pseudomonas sp. TTU2014-105ASC]MDH2240558.1 penicillin-binding protein 2 [Pseudomonas sp. GD03909]EHY79364.1 penicillin-binding protein 2 [Stutzerimonas stutzeri ATCC 14405 = CCUG 16156]MBA1237079.1 penicillin-binding protein 2 [Stutzerimonas kunmingensis]MCQ4254463.1 penicillin-binding protein 2 [Stutzerimonas stutzeri]
MPQPIQLKDHEKDALLVRRRVIVGLAFVLALIGVLVARMYYLQVVQFEHHSTLSENNRVHVQPIPPNRGLIFDRQGRVIADNRPSFSLTVTRERAGDWRVVLDSVVELLELGEEERGLFEKRVLQGRRPFEPVPIMYELSEEQIARVAVNQFRLPGVEVAAQLVRHYPQGAHFAHSVGYVGRINEQEIKQLDPVNYSGTHHIGKTGIEKFYEDELHGQVGYEEVETNARGRVLRVLKRTDPIPGKDITLSLDLDLQEAAEDALGGRRGAIVALLPDTGEVVAMVSQPSFNPNLFVTGISFKDYGELRDSIDRPLYNRVLRGLYPPGSTIKPMMAVAGLDAGVITPTSRVFDPGFFQLPNVKHKYRNWNRSGDGWVDLDLAIARSNDTYFYDMAHKMGVDRMHDYMTRFGLGQRVSLDMHEETAGLMPSRDWKRARYRQPWYPGETVILGIGQGYMQATPLQLAQATALMATRGKWIRPHLARSIGGRVPVDPDPVPDIQLRDPRFWDYANHGMEQVLHGARGTARKVGDSSVYRIAGKSGTAQVVAIRQGEKYDSAKLAERHRDHALFVAFAPVHDPKIAVAVMVENGESGSGVAAPVAKLVMDAWLLDEEGKLKAEFAAPLTAEGKTP